MIHAGEFIGHRLWLVGKGLTLYSVSGMPWHGGIMRTQKEPVSEDAFNEAKKLCCHGGSSNRGRYVDAIINLGVHAFKDQEDARHYIDDIYTYKPVVFGTVEMWGVVREHARGYRAQFARIRSIDMAQDGAFDKADLNKLRERYGLCPELQQTRT